MFPNDRHLSHGVAAGDLHERFGGGGGSADARRVIESSVHGDVAITVPFWDGWPKTMCRYDIY